MLSLTCDFGEATDDNILGQVIEKCSDGYLRLREVQPTILQVYRSTPHAGTDLTLAKLFLNREITTKLPTVPEIDHNNPEDRYKEYQIKLCEYTDAKRHAQQHDLGSGDIVFVANTKSGILIPTFGHQKYVICS